MSVKRYKIGFSCQQNGRTSLLWDGGEMINLHEALDAIQKIIDQCGSNPEWRNGAVLAYNAISTTDISEAKIGAVE